MSRGENQQTAKAVRSWWVQACRLRPLCWWLLVLGLLTGCRRPSQAVARLDSGQGTVERDHATRAGSFTPARPGDEFFLGDAVRTGRASSASLSLGENSRLTLEESTLVRFRAAAAGARRIELELGQAVVTTGERGLSLETSFGEALLEPRASLRLVRSSAGLRFEVTFGSAILELRGERRRLGPGGKLEVSIGLAVLDAPSSRPSRPAPSASSLPCCGMTAEVDGEGASLRLPGREEFEPLNRGSNLLVAGSVLRLPAGTTVTLRTARGSLRLSGPGQFSLRDSSEAPVGTDYGMVRVDSREGPLAVVVPGGVIRVLGRSQASLRTDRSSTKVASTIGNTSVEGSRAQETLAPGEQAELRRDGTIQRSRRLGLEYSDLIVPAGESFVVHDPHPPSAVGFGLAVHCPRAAVLEVTGRLKEQLIGEQTISVLLGVGRYSYRVRCLDAEGEASEPVTQGTVVVVADAGTRRLPSKAPTSIIDTDGRHYTVLFQNQLPVVTVRWPGTTSMGPFFLSVRPAQGSSHRIATPGPAYTFASGRLVEGEYELVFEGGNQRSAPTSVSIRFDDAAPTLSITSPADGSFAPGAEVVVAGTVVPGSRVSVGGVELEQDEQHRFRGSMRAPTTERALSVRFVQPQRGVHYYLRRPAGASR